MGHPSFGRSRSMLRTIPARVKRAVRSSTRKLESQLAGRGSSRRRFAACPRGAALSHGPQAGEWNRGGGRRSLRCQEVHRRASKRVPAPNRATSCVDHEGSLSCAGHHEQSGASTIGALRAHLRGGVCRRPGEDGASVSDRNVYHHHTARNHRAPFTDMRVSVRGAVVWGENPRLGRRCDSQRGTIVPTKGYVPCPCRQPAQRWQVRVGTQRAPRRGPWQPRPYLLEET